MTASRFPVEFQFTWFERLRLAARAWWEELRAFVRPDRTKKSALAPGEVVILSFGPEADPRVEILLSVGRRRRLFASSHIRADVPLEMINGDDSDDVQRNDARDGTLVGELQDQLWPYMVWIRTRAGRETDLVDGLRRVVDILDRRFDVDRSQSRGGLIISEVPQLRFEQPSAPPDSDADTLLVVDTEPQDCAGVTIAVIDGGVDPNNLPDSLRGNYRHGGTVRPLPDPDRRYGVVDAPSVSDPHGEAVVRAIGRTALGASLVGYDIVSGVDNRSSAPLLAALFALGDPDVVNLSLSITDEMGMHAEMRFAIDGFLSMRSALLGTTFVAATGAAEPGDSGDPMAFPARHDDVVAIGSLGEGNDPTGSRWGGKGTDAWWVLPGGSPSRPLSRSDGGAFWGTSAATALATGVIAATLARVRNGDQVQSRRVLLDRLRAMSVTPRVPPEELRRCGQGTWSAVNTGPNLNGTGE